MSGHGKKFEYLSENKYRKVKKKLQWIGEKKELLVQEEIAAVRIGWNKAKPETRTRQEARFDAQPTWTMCKSFGR